MTAQSSVTQAYRTGKRRRPKVLVPLMPGSDIDSSLRVAKLLSHSVPVLLLGLVPMEEGENMSQGLKPTRELRSRIQAVCDREMLRAKPRVRVTYTPWKDIKEVIQQTASIELLVLDWSHELSLLKLTAKELLAAPPCDVALIRGPFPEEPRKILVPVRGGPHADRAVRIGLALASANEADVTTLRMHHPSDDAAEHLGFAGLGKVVSELPRLHHRSIVSENGPETLLGAAEGADVVVIGTSADPAESASSFGIIPDALLERGSAAIIAVKTKKRVSALSEPSSFGTGAISVLVDQWFAENTFHADEFADLQQLAELKAERGVTVSLALPTLNEEKTVEKIIRIAQDLEKQNLLDEIVLIDSNSTDSTREIAADLGVPVYIHQEVLPQYGARAGKGEALWKSLYLTRGDIVLWVDTDVSNFHPRFIYGLLGPLLHRWNLQFVKGFYRRPIKTGSGTLQSGKGGRVTELTARPLLNLFYPELSGIIQPLSGEYGGRREALEQLTFTSGYGVETSVLIEVFEKFKLASIAQVDMIERIHNNQPLGDLSKMSFAIIQTLFARLEKRYGRSLLEDVNRTMKLIRYEADRFYLDVEEIAEKERPPIIELPEYRERHNRQSEEVSEERGEHGEREAEAIVHTARAN